MDNFSDVQMGDAELKPGIGTGRTSSALSSDSYSDFASPYLLRGTWDSQHSNSAQVFFWNFLQVFMQVATHSMDGNGTHVCQNNGSGLVCERKENT